MQRDYCYFIRFLENYFYTSPISSTLVHLNIFVFRKWQNHQKNLRGSK